MEKVEYQLLAEQEETFWWNVGRRKILREALERHIQRDTNLDIFDVGCGPGGNILFLKKFGKVTGVDISEEALTFARTRGYADLLTGDACALPSHGDTLDLVVALDVIEHIEDDTRAMGELFRVLRYGGIALITVPAYQWLWSEHDVALHHKRRYARSEFLRMVTDAGFSVRETSYFVIPTIPYRALKFAADSILRSLLPPRTKEPKSDVIVVPSWLNQMFIWWLVLESLIMRRFRIPFGSSLMVIAAKEEKNT